MERYFIAIEDVQRRLERILATLNDAGVAYALVGGQAVAFWVSTRDPGAVRTTKDVDLLIRRDDLPGARAAALNADMEANRDHDRAHLRDMIDVGLVDRTMLAGLPAELASRLDTLLTEQGR